jgi:hypothetical protein
MLSPQRWSLDSRARRKVGLEPGISLQKYSENTREMRLLICLPFVPRAFLRIFHRDEPDSSHCSLLGLAARASVWIFRGLPVARYFGRK